MIYIREYFTFFSSRSFIVSCLTLKSFIHLEFIFVYGERLYFDFTDLQAAVQLSQYHLQKRLSFSIVYSCCLCQILIDLRCVAFLIGSVFCSISVFVPVPCCFAYCNFTVLSEVLRGLLCILSQSSTKRAGRGARHSETQVWLVAALIASKRATLLPV